MTWMENYVVLSLETHLFFSRIMKEHAIFLEAGFPCVDRPWIERAEWFRLQFEQLLRETVQISGGRVNRRILCSQELATEFTLPAERRTEHLTGIPIDSSITRQVSQLSPCRCINETGEAAGAVDDINGRALQLLEEFIDFKENILEEVGKGNLYNANYPLLIQHILREAKLYHATLTEIMADKEPCYKEMKNTEEFWNCVMMEHALFIRGLLDPSEEELIKSADKYALKYRELLEKAKQQDCIATIALRQQALEDTQEFCRFKAAGTKGILNCEISSVIFPLLADHVLREANHYIRLLQTDCAC